MLDEQGIAYRLLNYQPDRCRFELSNNLRVLKIDLKDDVLEILVSPEQQPYIE